MNTESEQDFLESLKAWQEYKPNKNFSKEAEIKQSLSMILGCEPKEVALSGTLT
jgi:hypothetical protein